MAGQTSQTDDGSHFEQPATGAPDIVPPVGHEPSRESLGGQTVEGRGDGGGGGGEGQMKELQKGLSEEALRIAQLLSVSPDVVNISVNVG